LGIRKQGGTLIVAPALPSDWPGFAAKLNIGGRTVRVTVERGKGKKGSLTVNGRAAKQIDLKGKGDLDIKVVVGG